MAQGQSYNKFISTASRLITYEDTLLLREDKLTEIVKGELRTMPPRRLSHARLTDRLAAMLRRRLDPDRFEVLTSSFGQLIQREPFTYRIPDLGVYLQNRLVDEYCISTKPELLAEVTSPANRKGRIEELIGDYEHLQAPEVWLVFPEDRRIRRLLLQSSKLADAGTHNAGPLAPQFAAEAVVDLDELWGATATPR